MIQIRDKILSLEIFETSFLCNLEICKGNCCIYGDSGAPLNEDETGILEAEYMNFKSFITTEGRKSIEQKGKWLVDRDGDLVTPLIEGKECAYAVIEKGIARCGIENAWKNGKTSFRKPVSCHLYPVRISKLGTLTALNYHRWSVCKPATQTGNVRGISLYVFLKDALIRAFGEAFYKEMEKVAMEIGGINSGKIIPH
jgi:hypothetical protein